MSKKNVLFINGIGDNGLVTVRSITKNGQHILGYTGGTNLFEHIKSSLFEKAMLILDSNQSQDISLQKYDLIFNQISDADTHKITLSKVKNIYNVFPRETVLLNHPNAILNTTRESIYKNLQNINNLIVPKTIRISPKSVVDIYNALKKENLIFPIIFRQAGDHGGISTILIEDDSQRFDQFALDGRDYYLTQYVDYKHQNTYTKYRLIIIDGEVFIRHCIFSDNWIIHSQSRENKYLTLEQTTLENFDTKIKPKIAHIITNIYKTIQLDYFGIDCNIDKENNILLFELNANMNVLLKSNNYTDKYTLKINQAITDMIHRNLL